MYPVLNEGQLVVYYKVVNYMGLVQKVGNVMQPMLGSNVVYASYLSLR